MSDHPSKNFNKNKPVAWAFYNTDGSLRFIIDDERRMLSWKSSHNGSIIPLVPMKDHNNPELGKEYYHE
jgi:hypothetical protein